MNFEPLDTENGEVYEFVNEVTGGHITKEFIPSIDAGVQEAMESGILAGFPVVGVKATVTDGQVHDVDSSEMAFKIAGSMCFKEAAPKAKPVILEPIMAVEVRTPEEYMGDVMGDLNSRRGSIQSMNDATGVKVIDAKVPLSEMFGYIGDLRSKTGAVQCSPCRWTRTRRSRRPSQTRSSRPSVASDTRYKSRTTQLEPVSSRR